MINPATTPTGDAAADPAGRLLIADDIAQNRELLEAHLAVAGHEIGFAVDGDDTLAKVAEFKPDVILLDIMMPKLSGYEVCRQLKTDPETRGIPILMVTALDEPGDIEKAVAAGADDFLSKPINRVELTTRVRSLLRVRTLADENERLLAYIADVEKQSGAGR